MTSIDAFVSKGDGIAALIEEVARLTHNGPGPPTAKATSLELDSAVHT
jgi:hypothetical protein